MRPIEFRVWTGKKMIYQDKQYLASFIRRVVPEIIRDHGGEPFSQHESYLPNGGVIDEYLLQFIGLKDKHGKKIFDGDILRVDWCDSRYPVHNIGPVSMNIEEARWSLGEGGWPKHDAECYMEVIGNIYENSNLLDAPAFGTSDKLYFDEWPKKPEE